MQTAYPPPSVGALRHRVTLDAPGAAVPDGEGGFTREPAPLTPAEWRCSIRPATTADQERAIAGTLLSHRSYVVRGRYHPGITLATRLTFESHLYQVTSINNLDERDRELELIVDRQD